MALSEFEGGHLSDGWPFAQNLADHCGSGDFDGFCQLLGESPGIGDNCVNLVMFCPGSLSKSKSLFHLLRGFSTFFLPQLLLPPCQKPQVKHIVRRLKNGCHRSPFALRCSPFSPVAVRGVLESKRRRF